MVKVNHFLLSLFVLHEVNPVESIDCFDDIQNAMEFHNSQQLGKIKKD